MSVFHYRIERNSHMMPSPTRRNSCMESIERKGGALRWRYLTPNSLPVVNKSAPRVSIIVAKECIFAFLIM